MCSLLERLKLRYFYPRPPRGGRPRSSALNLSEMLFLSTPSARRATKEPPMNREEGDVRGGHAVPVDGQFLSTPSARRATRFRFFIPLVHHNFYPRPPRGGRHLPKNNGGKNHEFLSTPSARRATWIKLKDSFMNSISIHALREEGDRTWRPMVSRPSNFYPRPPRGGRRKRQRAMGTNANFYPRPPRGGRPP